MTQHRKRGLFEIVSPSAAILGNAPITPRWIAALEAAYSVASSIGYGLLAGLSFIAPVAIPVLVVLMAVYVLHLW